MVLSTLCLKPFRKVFAAAVLLCITGVAAPAVASAIDTACDANFMTRLRERAWGEAQREMMTNQQMIWKPDSVFHLGCYENFLNGFNGAIGFYNNKNYVQTTVKNNVNTYLNANFNHNLGGGNLSNSPSTSSCGDIKKLWEAAECRNLTLGELQSLGDASSTDPRKQPKSCSNTGASWTASKDVITKAGANTTYDAMNLFTNVTAPLSETSPVKCSAGIPTGVMLGGGSNPEVVCPNPGCSPTGTATPKCCKSGTTSSNCS